MEKHGERKGQSKSRDGGAAGRRGGPGSSVPALRVIVPKQSVDSLLKEVGAARATPLPVPGGRGAARGRPGGEEHCPGDRGTGGLSAPSKVTG